MGCSGQVVCHSGQGMTEGYFFKLVVDERSHEKERWPGVHCASRVSAQGGKYEDLRELSL